MNSHQIRIVALLVSLPLTALADYQPLQDIRSAAEQHARGLAQSGQVEVEAGGLDSRLRLPVCDQALEAFTPLGARARRATTVGVRCPGASGWAIYVPVRMLIRRDVLVAARTLRRGDALGTEDVEMRRVDVSSLPYGYFDDRGAVVGQILRRGLNPGQVIAPAALSRPMVIQRGQAVTLVTRIGGIEIRARGRALADAAPDQRIEVRNESSGRVVEGFVRSADIVEVAG